MITGMSFVNHETGTRTTIKFSGGTHGHWHVSQNINTGLWSLQWGYREGLGTRYEKPWPQHQGMATRKEAEALKKELRAKGVTGWNGPPAAPEVP